MPVNISVIDVLTWFAIAVAIYVIICACVSAYARYFSKRDDSSSWWYNFPAWVQPTDFWTNTLFNIGPNTYSFISNVSTLDTTILSGGVYSNAAINDCMLHCEGNKSCTGFTYVANTCSLVSGFDGMLPVASSNAVYFVDGSAPSKSFLPTAGKTISLSAINISSIAIPYNTNVATFTTTTNHGFTTGDYVNISGTNGPNGMNVVTVTDTTHFTFPYIVSADTNYGAGGTATRIVSFFTTSDSLFDCATKCYSNTSCTGFTFNSSPQTCVPYVATTLTANDVSTASSTSNTYLYGSLTVNSYTNEYWS